MEAWDIGAHRVRRGGAVVKGDPTTLLPLGEYDKVIVAFSGGKDSLAVALRLLDLGVDPARMELWHHRVDGGPGDALPWGLKWDWSVTDAYVEAVAEALDIPLFYSWRVGGISGEMAKQEARIADVMGEFPGPLGVKVLRRLETTDREVEAWGTRDDGAAWRVHLVRAQH